MKEAQSIDEAVRQRRLHATLAEAAGQGVPSDLCERIMSSRCAPSKRSSNSSRWLIAAGLALGLGVTSAVAFVSSGVDADRQEVQDPKPEPVKPGRAVIDDASVKVEGVGFSDEGEARSRLIELAGYVRRGVVVSHTVTGMSRTNILGLSGLEAVFAVAAEVGASVAEHDGILLVGMGGRSLPNSRVTIQCVDVPLAEFLRTLHKESGVNLVISERAGGLVTCNVKNAPWRHVLSEVAGMLQLDVVGCGSVLAIKQGQKRASVDNAIKNADGQKLLPLAHLVARMDHADVVVPPELHGAYSLQVRFFHPRTLLEVLAAASAADLSRTESSYRLEPSILDRGDMTLNAEHLTPRELVDVIRAKSPECVVQSGASEKVTVLVKNSGRNEVLQALASAVGRQLKRTGTHYSIE